MDVRDSPLKPLGYQQLTVSTAAVGLTVPSGARVALLKLDNANTLRWRDDGTDPSSTVGMILDTGDEFIYTGNLSKFKAIRLGGTDAVLSISYYR